MSPSPELLDEPCCGNCGWWDPDFLPAQGLAYGEAPCCWGECRNLLAEMADRGAYKRSIWWITQPCPLWENRDAKQERKRA